MFHIAPGSLQDFLDLTKPTQGSACLTWIIYIMDVNNAVVFGFYFKSAKVCTVGYCRPRGESQAFINKKAHARVFVRII